MIQRSKEGPIFPKIIGYAIKYLWGHYIDEGPRGMVYRRWREVVGD